MKKENELLILAVGNPSRGDDGLGPQFISELKKRNIESQHYSWIYQLSIEHAENFAQFNTVLIVDAKKGGDSPFTFERISASEDCHFSTHILLPQNILSLTRYLYQANPNVYLLAIAGQDFDLSENLGHTAKINLAHAVNFVIERFDALKT